MKLNKIAMGIAAAGMLSAFAVPAQAAVIDSWQATINGNTYTDIGRLSLVAGTATVEQEVNGLGQVFVGARFIESTVIYSINYVLDNVVGSGDSGGIALFATNDATTLTVSPSAGVVTALIGSGFAFNFTSGTFLLEETVSGDDLANGILVGIGGTLNNTAGAAGSNGQSVQDIILTALLNGFDIKDSTGASLAPALTDIVFEAQTNNSITSASGPAACSFDADALCLTLNINSNGDAFLVPEPATLGLLGLGLFGMGVALRKRKSA